MSDNVASADETETNLTEIPSPTLAKVFELQEAALVGRIEAVRVTEKGELIGADLENAILEALTNLLPATIKVTSGFIVKSDGKLSSHFDVLLVDTRYPLLATVAGSALVPLYALLGAIELKTTLTGKELDNVIDKGRELVELGHGLRDLLKQNKQERLDLILREIEEAKSLGEEEKALFLQGEISKSNGMLVDISAPIFSSLALTSELSEVGIAERLWRAKSEAEIMVLRPKKEKRPPLPPAGMLIRRMGTSGAARHFWLECLKDPCIRGTEFGFGFFLLQTSIQQTGGVLTGRGFSLWEIDEHLNLYAALLIDVSDQA